MCVRIPRWVIKYFSAFTGIVALYILSNFQIIFLLYIYLVSLVFSESDRLSFANGIDATHKKELNIRRVLH